MAFWPFIVWLAAFYAIVSTPLFAGADTPPSPRPSRVSSLDGLRGVLALAVLVHHAALFRGLAVTGHWGVLPSRPLFGMGAAAVAFFFMITGTLFWSMLLREAGRPDWTALYVGRLFRIAPLYLVAVVLLFAATAVADGFRLPLPAMVIARRAADWLALGAHRPVDLDGTGRTMLLLGVAWSLHDEWCFYAALLPLALAARLRRMHLPVVALALAVALAAAARVGGSPGQPGIAVACSLFLFGMLGASLARRVRLEIVPRPVASCIVIALVAAALRQPLVYAALPVGCLGLAFLLILSGADLFGLLRTRAARRAGDASYGIYLLHLFVLNVVLHVRPLRLAFLDGAPGFWGVTLGCGVASMAAATLAHLAVERPGIMLGRRVLGAVRRAVVVAGPLRQ